MTLLRFLLIAFPTRLGSIITTLVSLHPTTDRLRRNTLADFDIWLLNNHTRFNRLATATTVLSSQHPFAISIRELADWDDADAGLVVTAITRTKSYTPPGLFMLACVP
jgi:hypothetical protein